jgi:hypothetical protein
MESLREAFDSLLIYDEKELVVPIKKIGTIKEIYRGEKQTMLFFNETSATFWFNGTLPTIYQVGDRVDFIYEKHVSTLYLHRWITSITKIRQAQQNCSENKPDDSTEKNIQSQQNYSSEKSKIEREHSGTIKKVTREEKRTMVVFNERPNEVYLFNGYLSTNIQVGDKVILTYVMRQGHNWITLIAKIPQSQHNGSEDKHDIVTEEPVTIKKIIRGEEKTILIFHEKSDTLYWSNEILPTIFQVGAKVIFACVMRQGYNWITSITKICSEDKTETSTGLRQRYIGV